MSQRYKGAIISATPPTTSTSSASGEWTLAQQAQAQGASAWPVANPDPYFNQVSLLLHGDGTNGGQNNTFLDSSPPGGYSVYFDGNGDQLRTSGTGLNDFGTGDFTIESFVYITPGATSYSGYGRTYLLCPNPVETYSANNLGININGSTIGASGIQVFYNSSALINYTTAIPQGVWNHIAVTRSSGTMYLFVNGVSVASVSSTQSFTNVPISVGGLVSTNPIYNDYLNGYVSNFRIVKGTAVYTSNFTPTYGNLTAVSGTSLLTCQGPNIVDNSPNAFPITVNGGATVASPVTITRTGNVAQGTFSPFSLAEGQWSNYFGTTGANLSLSSTINLTSDFTCECWVYRTANDSNQSIIFTNSGAGFYFGYTSSGGMYIYMGSGQFITTGAGTALTPNAWHHFAVTRSGTTVYGFVNGVLIISGTATANPSLTQIGGYATGFNVLGYLSNVRVVNGTALYTSNFTPPTSALTAITNTSLLTCQSNRFVDNSANNFTITPSGDTKVTAWSPFIPALTPYSTSTNGGSGYFDGTGDYLTVPDSSGLRLGGNNFTLEAWFYPTSSSNAGGIIGKQAASVGNNGEYLLYKNGTSVGFAAASSDGSWNICNISGGTLQINAWNHVAATRNGSTITLWLNGISVGTATSSTAIAATSYGNLSIAANKDNGQFPNIGYLGDVRIVNGTALYTSNFTPPTAPLTAVTNTKLLLNCTNAAIYDNAIKNDIETVGNAQISTSVKKYGTGSMYFDGTDDRLVCTGSATNSLGTGNFTIEAWGYPTGTSAVRFIAGTGEVAGTWSLGVDNSSGLIKFWKSSNTLAISSSSNATINAWNHIAVVRSGTTLTMYLNGTSVGSTTDSSNYTVETVIVGDYGNLNGQPWQGYIDDLRITKGVARYTANFVPPIQAFPDY